jgi:Bardet-Biedl syndrome 5 protein
MQTTRVDCSKLRLRAGEVQIEKIEHVEDVKGNHGDRGTLRVTNLRLIWNSTSMSRINLCT